LLRRLKGRPNHFRASADVDCQHLDVEPGGGCHRFGNSVGDVVKFQIEKHRPAGLSELANDFRSGAGEEFAADFESANDRRQLCGQRDSS